MQISEHIQNEAKEILKEQKPLPQRISSAPVFHVANASDDTIHAFGYVKHEGGKYKIGTLKA